MTIIISIVNISMGIGVSKLDFPCEPEKEMFKLYFYNKLYDKSIESVDFTLPDSSLTNEISSIVYTFQFISNKRVVEEVTLTNYYNIKRRECKIVLRKHILANTEDLSDHIDIEKKLRVGFPKNAFQTKTRTIVRISKGWKNKFIISLIDLDEKNQGDYNKDKVIGILDFKNVTLDDNVEFDPVILCTVNTFQGKQIDFNKIRFVLESPKVNNKDYIPLSFYRYRICTDQKNNKIYVEDKGIEGIEFKNDIGNIKSWIVEPEVSMIVDQIKGKDYLQYSFSRGQKVKMN